ncbi:4089_t:CDS:2 [Gigaspora margarita]|uniref:4089_t:CDS:1 n=1 Tax=Gigaspora margarita TaxID=4874 RepID=A0ABN7UWF0_GIGMA|nr:4089_t:CDS:2 [Gigaspora margarita]
MSSHGYNPSNIHEATLPEDSNHTINLLLSEIITYFVDRGFQESLVRSFLEGEGSGVSGIASGEDKRLLVKWGLIEEAASELRILSFEDIFYDKQFPCNQWISYDRKGGPQMFASSYKNIATGIDDFLSSNTKNVVAALRCEQRSAVDDNDFVYGYQLSNPREVLSEWANNGGDDVEGSWQNVIPHA